MKQYLFGCILVLVIILPSILFSQHSEIAIDAGDHQFINWDNTKTLQLNGSVSSKDIKIEWSCPVNSNIKFKDI